MSAQLTHKSIFNGKRRCHTQRMPHAQHLLLHAAHRECRTSLTSNMIPDDQVINIGTVFHFVSPDHSRKIESVIPVMQSILHMMNACFGNSVSPKANLEHIEKGPFLSSSSHHQDLYKTYKSRACAANLRFLLALPPPWTILRTLTEMPILIQTPWTNGRFS